MLVSFRQPEPPLLNILADWKIDSSGYSLPFPARYIRLNALKAPPSIIVDLVEIFRIAFKFKLSIAASCRLAMDFYFCETAILGDHVNSTIRVPTRGMPFHTTHFG